MYKITSPSSKGCIFSSESPSIPEDPYIPSWSEHNFKEEGMLKPWSCMLNTLLNIRASGPVNAEVVPNSATEIVVEEQVQHVLIHIFIADHTKVVFLADLQCLRTNISLVLSLSKNNNQPKTLIFMVDLISRSTQMLGVHVCLQSRMCSVEQWKH